VGIPRYGMTLNTPRLTEKEQRAALLRIIHRGLVAARKHIDRGVGKRQTELELGDRSGEHFVGDRPAVTQVTEYVGEKLPILLIGVESCHDGGANAVVGSRRIRTEACHLSSLCRGDERLRCQQVREE